jgi:hypothetical protein
VEWIQLVKQLLGELHGAFSRGLDDSSQSLAPVCRLDGFIQRHREDRQRAIVQCLPERVGLAHGSCGLRLRKGFENALAAALRQGIELIDPPAPALVLEGGSHGEICRVRAELTETLREDVQLTIELRHPTLPQLICQALIATCPVLQ